MPLRNLIIILVSAVVSLICYEKTQRNRYATVFAEALHIVEHNYVDEVDSRVLFEGAMDGMVERLDEHSAFISPERLQRFQESLDQEFAGVGIIVEMNEETDRLSVAYPFIGQPAQRAGVRKGDTILAIDGKTTEGLAMDEAVELMRGKEGEIVTLNIRHLDAEEPVDLAIERAIIPIESVLGDSRRKDGSWRFVLDEDRRIGYIRLTTFGEHSVEELRDALTSIAGDVDALILDLRDNSGGLLTAAVEICDMFIDDAHYEGRIVSTKGRGGVTREEYFADAEVDFPRHLPMAVLVNGQSASASEILAACVKDHQRAVVVGRRTWGKGTVQNIIHLENGRSALKLTTASYWRPSGKNIHRGHNDKRERIPYDAEDKRDWGVRPTEGFEVSVEEDLLRKVVTQRRQRDYTNGPWKPSSAKQESDESKEADESNGLDGSNGPARSDGPADDDSQGAESEPVDDPQLRKAIDYLQQQLRAESGGSRAA